MATSRISLDPTQYVRVNFGLNPIIVEASEGEVKVVITENQPALTNKAFHRVDNRARLSVTPDANVWVLATSEVQKCVVTEDLTGQMPSDPSGNTARNTLLQEQLVAQRTDNINVQFQYNVPINDDTSDIDGSTTGTGTITHNGSQAVVSTGTGIGSAHIESRDSVRYYPGHEFAAELTAFTYDPDLTGVSDTVTRWGLGDVGGTGDAMCFIVQDGEFGIEFRSGGVSTFIPRSSFLDPLDGTGPSGFDLAQDTLNLWTFRGGWYGILPLQWGIYTTEKGYITCYVHDMTNSQQSTHLTNPTLPMFVEVERTAGTGDDLSVETASWRGGICGPKPKGSRADRTQVVTIEEKSVAAGADVPVISLRNNATSQGKTNHVRIRYGTVSLFTDGNKPVIWKVFKNGTLTGESWVAKNTDTSVADYDVSATSYTNSNDPIGGVVMGKVDTARINLFEGDVILAAYPGETITFTARSSSTTTVSLFFRWIEEF